MYSGQPKVLNEESHARRERTFDWHDSWIHKSEALKMMAKWKLNGLCATVEVESNPWWEQPFLGLLIESFTIFHMLNYTIQKAPSDGCRRYGQRCSSHWILPPDLQTVAWHVGNFPCNFLKFLEVPAETGHYSRIILDWHEKLADQQSIPWHCEWHNNKLYTYTYIHHMYILVQWSFHYLTNTRGFIWRFDL